MCGWVSECGVCVLLIKLLCFHTLDCVGSFSVFAQENVTSPVATEPFKQKPNQSFAGKWVVQERKVGVCFF